MENLVAVTLKRRCRKEFFYLKSAKTGIGIDFSVPEKETAIQVACSIRKTIAYEREVENLINLSKTFQEVKHFLIITMDEDKTIKEDGIAIRVLPLYRFLLEF